ncbi:hypothetical protein K438DRAFT_33739 [Mycena galopus ATCC 62051]|nr:hypothetical protein K438DRAFT_33739 [Mycena galopus ATCC 62051]
MSSTPREIGTLIVVILKANHLPNKRNIGKQDPYCLVSVNGEKQRTKVVKRGGQHPEWDEEIRFKLFEDDSMMINGPDGAPPPLPPKDGKKNIKGGSVMKLSCFADDPREPSLIGQADVDLTEVLTKGETDEWFTLMNKDKFAGKVYLELTFWSNEAPPEKKVAPVAPKEYGGQGSFISSDTVPDYRHPSSRVVSTNDAYAHSRRQSDSGQSTLRASNSLAQLDFYRPAYEQQEPHHPSRSRVASFSTLTNDFAELGVDPHRRRESLSPAQQGFVHGRPPSVSYHRATYPPPHGYEPTSDAASTYQYDRPLTPPGHSQDPSNFLPYTPQAPYRPPYDPGPAPYNPPPSRGPRYSSGFMPIPNSNSSGFVPLPSHPSEPSGFAPPLSHTPAPSGYAPSHINPPNSYPHVASQTPAPGYAAPLPPSASADFHPQPGFPSSQPPYSQFQPQPPPQQYNPPPQTHMQTPTPPAQQGYALPPSPSNQPQGSLSHSNSLSSSVGPGSRPLPPPPQFHAAQSHQQPYGLPPGASQSAHPASYSPTPIQENYQPPPPPRPVSLHDAGPQSYIPGDLQSNPNLAYQAPPPPPPLPATPSPRRRSSLPPPPTHLQQQQQQQPNYQPLPPPPPPLYSNTRLTTRPRPRRPSHRTSCRRGRGTRTTPGRRPGLLR